MRTARNGSASSGSASGPSTARSGGAISGVSSSASRNFTQPAALTREAVERVAKVGSKARPERELTHWLAGAEHELQQHSSARGSEGESEERDSLHLAEHLEEEIERRSSVGISSAFSQDTKSVPVTATQSSLHKSSFCRANSSHSSGSSKGSRPSSYDQNLVDLLQRLAFAQDAVSTPDEDVTVLRRTIADMVARQGVQVDALQHRLQKAASQVAKNDTDRGALLQKIASMEAEHAAQTADLQRRLANSAAESTRSGELTSEIQDEMAGMQARHQARMENVRSTFKDELASLRHSEEEAQRGHAAAKRASREEVAALQQQLASSATSFDNAMAEREVLRRNLQTIQASHAAEVAGLNGLLVAATQQLKLRDSSTSSGDEQLKTDEDDRVNSIAADGQHMHLLQEKLAASQDSNRLLSSELCELRLQMLGMNRAPDTSEDAASPGPTKVLGRGGGHGAKSGKAGRGVVKLVSIEEEDNDDLPSMDGSVAAGLNVSESGDGIGNMSDFDDYEPSDQEITIRNAAKAVRVNLLQEELAQAATVHATYKEEVVGREAETASRLARLMALLSTSREEHATTEVALAALNQSVAGQGARHAVETDNFMALLSAEQMRFTEKDEEHESLKQLVAGKEVQHEIAIAHLEQQLSLALEMKKIGESRLEDMKGLVASMEKRHEYMVEDLRKQLLLAGGSYRDSIGGSEDGAMGEFLQQLRALEEERSELLQERNMLKHALELREVQWKSEIEKAELQHAANVDELRRWYEEKTSVLKQQLQDVSSELRRHMEEAQLRRSELELQQKLAATSGPSSTAAKPRGLLPVVFWLDALRCPVRRGSDAPQEGPATEAGQVPSCQSICWSVVSAVREVTAFLCSVPEGFAGLDILKASDKACSMWGGQNLYGKSLLTLAESSRGAVWLGRAITTHQGMAEKESGDTPGFLVRHLGCLEFRSPANAPLNSWVTVAHLPAELRHNRSAAVLVILEPRAQPQTSAAPPSPGTGAQAHREGRASQSVVSSSVRPSDSVSCVAERRLQFSPFQFTA